MPATNRHATRHWRAEHHPVVRWFQPREEQLWCYEDEVPVEPR